MRCCRPGAVTGSFSTTPLGIARPKLPLNANNDISWPQVKVAMTDQISKAGLLNESSSHQLTRPGLPRTYILVRKEIQTFTPVGGQGEELRSGEVPLRGSSY